VGIAVNIFKVIGQRSRLQRDQMHFCGGGMRLDGVASRRLILVYFEDWLHLWQKTSSV